MRNTPVNYVEVEGSILFIGLVNEYERQKGVFLH